jgi:hypothetical protein
MDEGWLSQKPPEREFYACFQIGVENRDYHQQSHIEIGGDNPCGC